MGFDLVIQICCHSCGGFILEKIGESWVAGCPPVICCSLISKTDELVHIINGALVHHNKLLDCLLFLEFKPIDKPRLMIGMDMDGRKKKLTSLAKNDRLGTFQQPLSTWHVKLLWPDGYPLVMTNIANWQITILYGKTHYFYLFLYNSMVMFNGYVQNS